MCDWSGTAVKGKKRQLDDTIKMFSSAAKFLLKIMFWDIYLPYKTFALLCLWMAGPFRRGFAQMEHAWKLVSLELAAKEHVNLFKNHSDFQMYLDRASICSKNAFPPWLTTCFPFSVLPSSPYLYNLPPVSPGYPPAQSSLSCRFQPGELQLLNFQPGSCSAIAYSFFRASTMAAAQRYSKKKHGSDTQPAWLPSAVVVASVGEGRQWRW